MTAQPDLEQRLRAIEDRNAISDLVYRYTEIIRWGREMVEGREFFTPDAVFETCSADPQRLGETLPRYRFSEIEAIMEACGYPKPRVRWSGP